MNSMLRTTRLLRLSLLVIPLALVFFGCTSPGTQVEQTENPNIIEAVPQQVTFTGRETAYVEDDDIVIARITQDSALEEQIRLPAENPREIVFNGTASVIWIEADTETQVHTIVEYSWLTETRSVLYTSPRALTDLAVSAAGNFIGYIEEQGLYLLYTKTGAVQRVDEDVYEYAFSPTDAQLVFSTDIKSEHATMDISDGSIAATIELTNAQQGPLRGLAFIDEDTVFGVGNLPQVTESEESDTDADSNSQQRESQAATIDLRNISLENTQPWPAAVQEYMNGGVDTLISASGNYAAVEELKQADKRGIILLHSFENGDQVRLSNNAHLVGILDDTALIVAQPADEAQNDTELLNLLLLPTDQTEEPITLIESIKAPHFSL